MAKILQIVERNKAEKVYRFINYIIDFGFAVLIMWILLGIYAVLKYFVLGVEIQESAMEIENMNPILDRVLSILMYAFIMFIIEKLSAGRSLGKLITGTGVVKSDGSALTTSDLFRRNLSRAVPFDQLSFLGTKGWHDTWSDTRVVNLKKFESAKRLADDMESLGSKENF